MNDKKQTPSAAPGLYAPVLQVIISTTRRGAEVSATQRESALTSLGHVIRTVALAPGPDPDGLDVPTLGPTSLGLRTLRALRTEVEGVSLAVACGSRTLPACALATPGTGVPFVYHSIGDPRYWSSSAARRLRVAVLLSRAKAIAVLWSGAAQTLVARYRVSPHKIWVIPNSRPAAAFPPIDPARRAAARAELGIDGDEARIVVYLGALGREKNLDLAITAIRQIPVATLLLVGDGPQRQRLEALAAVAPGQVRFLGTSDEPSRILAAADVVVLPSDTEGMPGVLIEAGLSGLPVVATDVGAVHEVIIDGKTGRLVPPGNSEALATALRETLENPGTLGQAARAHCLANFEMEPVTAQWSVFLREMLDH